MLSVATAAVVLASAALGSAQAVTGTYPPVPLASKGPFAYPSGIVSLAFAADEIRRPWLFTLLFH